MKVKLKAGDSFIEVDTELPDDEIEKLGKEENLEDTLEFDFNSEGDDTNELES